MDIYATIIDYRPAEQVFAAFADEPHALFLDSADRSHPDGRYSYIAVRPLEVITHNIESDTSDPFKKLESSLSSYGLCKINREDLPPYQGGAAGYFSYDLGRALESLPVDNPALPSKDMVAGIYDQVIAFDHARQKTWIIVHADNADEAQDRTSALQKAISNRPTIKANNKPVTFDPLDSKEQYLTKIQRVIDYIHAGDIFQANLAQHFSAALPPGFDAYAHYLHLRETSRAPFAGYFNAGDTVISSASPERFLCCTHDGHVSTKPIKGTRPNKPGMDQELLASAKDKAENTMIVDLLRNDLSKVCERHSVRVDKLCALESFANVHHLVSTITAKLKAQHSAVDLLSACFPGGSITGAPKIRAMEIIEELEPARRGPYCGALGYIGANGAMDTNILIRSITYHGGTAYLQAGGGIVADSDPEAEYQETLDKASGLLQSFRSQERAA